jgi:hypothetical protein
MTENDYNDYVSLFESDGWKLLIESISELERAITEGSVDNCPTNESWQYTRGQLHQLRSMLGYENFIKVSYENQDYVDVV